MHKFLFLLGVKFLSVIRNIFSEFYPIVLFSQYKILSAEKLAKDSVPFLNIQFKVFSARAFANSDFFLNCQLCPSGLNSWTLCFLNRNVDTQTLISEDPGRGIWPKLCKISGN